MTCGRTACHARSPSRQHHSLPVVWWDRQDDPHAPDAPPRIASSLPPVRHRYKQPCLRALEVVRPEFASQTCTLPASPDRPMRCAMASHWLSSLVAPPQAERPSLRPLTPQPGLEVEGSSETPFSAVSSSREKKQKKSRYRSEYLT